MHRWQITVTLFLVLAFLGLACAPKPAPAQPAPQVPTPVPQAAPAIPLATAPWGDWDKIIEAAKKEGRVNWYTAFISPPLRKTAPVVFKQRYGIDLEVVPASGPELGAKLDAEQRAKAYNVDVFDTGSTTFISTVKPQGYVVGPLVLPETVDTSAWRLNPWEQDPDRYLFTYSNWCAPLLINTRMVKPQDEPQSWFDLLDPKWKGKMLMYDPSISGPTAKLMTLVKNHVAGAGTEYWYKLAKQEPKIIRNPKEIMDMVIFGEYPIALGIYAMMTLDPIEKGAAVKLGWLKEAQTCMEYQISLVKNAPRPNAAKVFINWFLSKEGQTIFSTAARVPSDRRDVSQDHLNPQFRWREDVNWTPFKARETIEADENKKMLAEVFLRK